MLPPHERQVCAECVIAVAFFGQLPSISEESSPIILESFFRLFGRFPSNGGAIQQACLIRQVVFDSLSCIKIYV